VKLANNDTVLDSPLGLEATVASTPKLGDPDAPTRTGGSVRTTVLPRVEVVNAEPRIVANPRPRFHLLRKLGEGGHGEVTSVRDNDIGRDVAVKRLHTSVKSTALALRFAEEVRIVGQLEHPNIVPIHDVGVDENDDYYFVMKHVDGETLEDIIEKLAAGDAQYHARYGVERRVQIFGALLEAVAFAHTKGIVHRDIKPANVMVGAFGEVVLMDWGIAKRRQESPAPADLGPAAPHTDPVTTGRRGTLFETRIGELVGTPAYMSPEQARGAAVDERSDVYSLCIVLQELLSLTHPLASKTTLGDMIHGVQHEPVPFATLVAHPHQPPAPAELGHFIQKGVAKDPAQRFQSVSEMIDRLARREEGSFPIQCPLTFSKRILGTMKRFVDRHPYLASVALFALVGSFVALAASGILFALRR
jgi:serine/threonine-protein kinase